MKMTFIKPPRAGVHPYGIHPQQLQEVGIDPFKKPVKRSEPFRRQKWAPNPGLSGFMAHSVFVPCSLPSEDLSAVCFPAHSCCPRAFCLASPLRSSTIILQKGSLKGLILSVGKMLVEYGLTLCNFNALIAQNNVCHAGR